MKVTMLTTVKYGSGKYLHVGEVYDLDTPMPEDMKKALMSVKDSPAITRVVGMSAQPVLPDTEEPDITVPEGPHIEDTEDTEDQTGVVETMNHLRQR